MRETSIFGGAVLTLRRSGARKPDVMVGYAVVWDEPSEPFFDMREIVRRGAFTKTLIEGDALALWNHDPNMVLGRRSAGTLELVEDDHGLRVSITPPDTQAGRDAIETIRRGDVTQMSFGFRAVKDTFIHDDELGDLRELREVELLEVSPVPFPAYADTSIAVREKVAAVEHSRARHGLPRTPVRSQKPKNALQKHLHEKLDAKVLAPYRRRLESLEAEEMLKKKKRLLGLLRWKLIEVQMAPKRKRVEELEAKAANLPRHRRLLELEAEIRTEIWTDNQRRLARLEAKAFYYGP